jgi:hypothetical protein
VEGTGRALAAAESTGGNCAPCGFFFVLFDEAAEAAEATAREEEDSRRGSLKGGGRSKIPGKAEWR